MVARDTLWVVVLCFGLADTGVSVSSVAALDPSSSPLCGRPPRCRLLLQYLVAFVFICVVVMEEEV